MLFSAAAELNGLNVGDFQEVKYSGLQYQQGIKEKQSAKGSLKGGTPEAKIAWVRLVGNVMV